MLCIEKLKVAYGLLAAVADVDLEIGEGEIVAILGANGAGKSTIIKTIVGLLQLAEGSIVFDQAHKLHKLPPFKIHRLGISWVPEGRQIWGTLSVIDNLRMGAFTLTNKKELLARLEEKFELFPVLGKKAHQMASLLSGGEQQQLAIARCLMSEPRLILMDEPSLGLAPMAVNHVFEMIQRIRQRGVSILMAEQNAHKVLQVADKVYFLDMGRIIYCGTPAQVASMDIVKTMFLGERANRM